MVHEEKFLKEEPERLESALRRCKKLTGTLVTLKRYPIPIWNQPVHDELALRCPAGKSRCLKCYSLMYVFRLASVQEQRLPCAAGSNEGGLTGSVTETPPVTPLLAQHSKVSFSQLRNADYLLLYLSAFLSFFLLTLLRDFDVCVTCMPRLERINLYSLIFWRFWDWLLFLRHDALFLSLSLTVA